MLIEEIKKGLESGEVVELECVNRADFLRPREEDNEITNELILKQEKLIVKEINFGSILLDGDLDGGKSNTILKKELKYFRIKRHAPTFEYVVHVATQASLDKIIEINTLKHNLLVMTSEEFHNDDYVLTRDADDLFNCAIKWINSLYTETFVIEREDDIKKVFIDKETKIELANGVLCTVNSRTNCSGRGSLLYVCNSQTNRKDQLAFTALKGATVTQRKARNEISSYAKTQQ